MKCKKILALLLTLVLVVALGACGGDSGSGGQTVAKIQDAEITDKQLDEIWSLSAYIAGQDVSQFEGQEDILKLFKKSMLVNLVRYEAMRLSLEEEGTEVFPKDYDAQLKSFLESYKADAEKAGVSEDTLTYYFNLSFYAAPYQEEAQSAVTDEELQAYYDAHLADTYTLTEASAEVFHILVADEATANQVYDKLKGGADFGEMAGQYGTDGTKVNGGSLGVLSENQPDYDGDFMKGAFALKSGEISKPVKTQFGYHIIKLENRQEAGTVKPFLDVKESIRTTLASEKMNDMVEKMVAKYKVEYFGDYKDEPAGAEGTTGGAADGGDPAADGEGTN